MKALLQLEGLLQLGFRNGMLQPFSMLFLMQYDERVLREKAVGFTDVGTGDLTVAALHPASSLQLESFTQ